MFLIILLLMFAQIAAETAEQTEPPDRTMIIKMKTGDTHVSSPIPKSEGGIPRWFELQTATISTRYQYIENSQGVTTANRHQYQTVLKGRFRFDHDGNFSVHAGVFPGRNFSGGWNNSGWGTGNAVTNVYLKQLYLDAKPFPGVEFQYGGLYQLQGESTEMTSYDNDGYITGQRVTLRRPHELLFEEISFTAGYLGDPTTANLIHRFDRFTQVNFYHFLVVKKLSEHFTASAGYASESGQDVLRQAIRMELPEARVLDAVLFENYQRLGNDSGYGFGVYGEKRLYHRFAMGGGYAQIDRTALNSDRFPEGKRVHLESHITINPEFSILSTFTLAFGKIPADIQRTRFEVGFGYNLLHTLARAGLF